jgi:hypothetical protein
MTYQNDPNINTRPSVGARRGVRNDGFAWGIPAGIAAVVIVAGLLFYNFSGNHTNTASNTSPTTTQSTPTPAPTTTPAPAPTAPKGG